MIKEFHVSKNLFDGTLVQGAVSDTGLLFDNTKQVRAEYVPVQPNTKYTLSTDQSFRTVYAYNNRTAVELLFSLSIVGQFRVTFTTPNNCDSICFAIMSNTANADITPQDVGWVMLNTGSTDKPYEPYGDTWNTKSYVKSISGSQTYTKFPIVLRTTEQSIPTWSVKGNMQQTGTPSPSSIIMPDECGNQTANLFDKNTTPVSLYYNTQMGVIASDQNVVSIIIPVSPNTTYTFNNSAGNRNRICETETLPKMNDTVINYIASDGNVSITLTTSNDTLSTSFQGFR